MQGASHTLKSAGQYSNPSHFTDKKTKAPTVEFVQRLGSTGFQGIRNGARGPFSGRSFNPVVVLTRVSVYVCDTLGNVCRYF